MDHDEEADSVAMALIHTARQRLGWSLQRASEEIAAELGEPLSPNAVWKWEKGNSRPELEKVPAIERALRIPNNQLLDALVTARLIDSAAAGFGHTRAEGVRADGTPAGYDSRIAKLPEHVRRTIDDIIDTYEADRS